MIVKTLVWWLPYTSPHFKHRKMQQQGIQETDYRHTADRKTSKLIYLTQRTSPVNGSGTFSMNTTSCNLRAWHISKWDNGAFWTLDEAITLRLPSLRI